MLLINPQGYFQNCIFEFDFCSQPMLMFFITLYSELAKIFISSFTKFTYSQHMRLT